MTENDFFRDRDALMDAINKLKDVGDRYGIAKPKISDPLSTGSAFRYYWLTIALCLAADYAPEFKRRRPGAKRKWTPSDDCRLYVAIAHKMEEQKKGIVAACRSLAQQEPWKSLAVPRRNSTQKTADIIRQRFTRIRADLARSDPPEGDGGFIEIFGDGNVFEVVHRKPSKQRTRK